MLTSVEMASTEFLTVFCVRLNGVTIGTVDRMNAGDDTEFVPRNLEGGPLPVQASLRDASRALLALHESFGATAV